MEKKPNLFLPSTESVEKLFPQMKPLFSSKEETFSHEYTLLKLPRIPPFDHARKEKKMSPLNASKLNKKELQNDAKQANKCCAHQKDFLVFSESSIQLALAPGRVRNWRLKESLLAVQRLKKINKETNRKSLCKVTFLKKRDAQLEEDMQKTAAWQDLIHQREERQFLITRINKFLID